jgi:S-DNA-T family DNA segregation ATPase FtsK/SpoIIIE
VHVIDAGADLSDLADPARRPHVGTVVAAHDVERGTRLVAALTEEAQQRRRGGPAGAGSAPPLLLLVDGWESLVETWSRTDHGRGVEDLLRLARDGLSSGVRLAATGGRALLGGAVTATFSTRVLLPSADPHHAVLAGVPPARLPRHWPPGRILRLGRAGELIEAQVAQLDLDQGRPAAPGPTPLRLAPLPDHVELAPLLPAARRGIALIGVGGDEARPEGLPSDDGPGALVCGPPGSGRSTALLTLAASLSHDGRSVLLVAPGHVGQVPGPGVVLRTGWDGPLPLEPDAVLLLDTGWASVPGLQECAVRHLAAGGTALRVVAAATAAEVAVAFRGLLADLRGLRTGLLLGSRSAADGDALGVRAPPSAGLPPGRGLLVSRGHARPVQVARDPRWSP